MKTEQMSYNDYWSYVQNYFGVHDTITMIMNDECEEVIEFKNSCGCLLSSYNIDKEEVTWY